MRVQDFTYVLITPARNEAQFLELTINSVVAETARPLKWVIVSATVRLTARSIVSKYAAEHPWIELVRMPERPERHLARKVHGFNAGYATVKDVPYDVIGDQDGDISFGEDYFAFLMSKFAEDPRLGVGGTPYWQQNTNYNYRFATEYVPRACQLFRRRCFEEMGAYVPVKG